MPKYKKFVAAFDVHGDMQDTNTVRIFHEFVRWFKPSIRIHGGDNWDFRFLRRNADEQEQRERIDLDFEKGMEFIREYKPTHFLRGNHDERLWDQLKSDNHKHSYLAQQLIAQIKEEMEGTQMYPYDKRTGIMRLGHLKVIHGYHSGVTAARQAAQIYGSVIMGHIHTIDHYSIPGIEKRIGRACGCLCQLNMDYNRAQPMTLRQCHGWAYGILYPRGDYQLWQAESVNGKWLFPENLYCLD